MTGDAELGAESLQLYLGVCVWALTGDMVEKTALENMKQELASPWPQTKSSSVPCF